MKEQQYIKNLIEKATKVKLNLKSEDFFTGKIIGMSETGILFLDKYNSEIYFSFDDVLRITPTKTPGGN